LKKSKYYVSEYYKIHGIWKELDAMSELPTIAIVSDDIAAFLNALSKQQQENKLFQFLNGLDDELDHKGVKFFS